MKQVSTFISFSFVLVLPFCFDCKNKLDKQSSSILSSIDFFYKEHVPQYKVPSYIQGTLIPVAGIQKSTSSLGIPSGNFSLSFPTDLSAISQSFESIFGFKSNLPCSMKTCKHVVILSFPFSSPPSWQTETSKGGSISLLHYISVLHHSINSSRKRLFLNSQTYSYGLQI